VFAASMRFFAWFYLIFGWFRSLEKQKTKSTIFPVKSPRFQMKPHFFSGEITPLFAGKKTAAPCVDPPSPRLSVGLPAGISAPKPQRSETRRHPAAPA